MQGALGSHHEVEDGARAWIFAAPVFDGQAQPLGVVSVEVSVAAVGSTWVGDPQAIYFTDELGVVFISNRTEMLFRQRDGQDDPRPRRALWLWRGRDPAVPAA